MFRIHPADSSDIVNMGILPRQFMHPCSKCAHNPAFKWLSGKTENFIKNCILMVLICIVSVDTIIQKDMDNKNSF